jgi:(p)ppGpp synthase/HD superfamily hydrolase
MEKKIRSIGEAAREFAVRVHNQAGCTYGDDDQLYEVHVDMVAAKVLKFKKVFKYESDSIITHAAAYTHDTIEDAQQTFNDVREATSIHVAKVTLAVTDVQEENRLLRFLSTVPKILKDHRALVLKVCDVAANSEYGLGQKNSMHLKYKKEWVYKRPIFLAAANWYPLALDHEEFHKMILHVDELYNIK